MKDRKRGERSSWSRLPRRENEREESCWRCKLSRSKGGEKGNGWIVGGKRGKGESSVSNVIGRKGRVVELQIYFTSTIGRDISQFIYGEATQPLSFGLKKYRDPVSDLESRVSPFADMACSNGGPLLPIRANFLDPRFDFPSFKKKECSRIKKLSFRSIFRLSRD